EHARRAGKPLRPPAKTHERPEVARRQIAAGELGVACAKLGEAEVMARAGIRGLLITTEIVAPAALRRLTRLVSEAPDTLIVVDNADNVVALGREAAADGVVVGVLVDVDVGNRRTGVAPGEAAVVSVPTRDRAMVDAGLKAFSTDKPFPPEAVERPGIEYAFAGDEHGRLTITDPSRPPRLGERIEFFPPHCDPTLNLYDRVYAVRGPKVEAAWEIEARGRSD